MLVRNVLVFRDMLGNCFKIGDSSRICIVIVNELITSCYAIVKFSYSS